MDVVASADLDMLNQFVFFLYEIFLIGGTISRSAHIAHLKVFKMS